jgi:argininosuccinate lyase
MHVGCINPLPGPLGAVPSMATAMHPTDITKRGDGSPPTFAARVAYEPHDGGSMRTWGGRFSEETDARVADFTRSIEVDAALAADDIAGSIAHVHGLGSAGLLTDDEVSALVDGLLALAEDVAAGRLAWDPSLEDVHMNLEAALAAKAGPVAGKLHTGRSRNDQVATDLRLWTRRAIDDLDAALVGFERALVGLAERDGTAILPGTTHIQPAQPVLFAHHMLAYVEMAERDRARLADARRRVNVSPLGAGALAGAGYPLDRAATAAELGFDGVSANSMDAVADRDFVIETLAAIALGMVHLSRLAEEITWWSNPRFGFIRVADAFSTGSSIMPNKKNPDPAELVRGRAARVIGALAASLTLLKGLPLAYQRDLQEDKAQLFDAVAVFETSLRVLAGLLDTVAVDAGRMLEAVQEGHTTATAVADALVRRGVPFRSAHHIVGSLVAQADEAGLRLDAVPDSMIGLALGANGDPTAGGLASDAGIGDALRSAASVDGALASCDVIGGTAPARVQAALLAARERVERESAR